MSAAQGFQLRQLRFGNGYAPRNPNPNSVALVVMPQSQSHRLAAASSGASTSSSPYSDPLLGVEKKQKKRSIAGIDQDELVDPSELTDPDSCNSDVSLHELRDRLADFNRARGWEQFHSPRNLLLALVGEVGELSEIFQWKGEVAKGLPNWTSCDKEHLEEELSDVLLYLVQLADACGLDLGQAALTKISKNAQKHPVSNPSPSVEK